jgi:hypothetical protein
MTHSAVRMLFVALLDDPVRPRQHVRRNGETDLLSGFEIDH